MGYKTAFMLWSHVAENEERSSSRIMERIVRDQKIVLGEKSMMCIINRLNNSKQAWAIVTYLQQELKRLKKLVEENQLEHEQKILASQASIIFALTRLVESRDDETGGHLKRVELYCHLLSQTMAELVSDTTKINQKYIDTLSRASVLHDIGKVGVRDEILLKPGRLTAEEFTLMQEHTTIGYRILQAVVNKYPDNSYASMGCIVARSHHERWDGRGYPDGLSRESIPFPAKIVSLADVYDALRSKRCYKQAISHKNATEIIMQGRGTQFDPVVTDAFYKINQQLDDIRRQFDD